MERELYILRHGKSDWGNDSLKDHDRPLSKRGQRDMGLMADWMKQGYLYPGYVVCSTALRTRQTLSYVSEVLSIDEDRIHYDKTMYLASLSTLLSILASIPTSESAVMLVGHNPGLDQLVLHISASDVPFTSNQKLMTTSCLAHFKLPQQWDELESCAELVSITRPKQLYSS